MAYREELNELKRQIEILKQRDHVTVNNNTVVVILNNFGSEDVSHVIQDKSFLDECISSLKRGIPNVIERIYYDETKPENKTVVVKSVKRKTALIHSDGKWIERDLNQIVPIMVRNGSNILSMHLRNKDITDDERQQDVLAKQSYIVSVMTQKKPEYDMVSSAVKAVICNYK